MNRLHRALAFIESGGFAVAAPCLSLLLLACRSGAL